MHDTDKETQRQSQENGKYKTVCKIVKNESKTFNNLPKVNENPESPQQVQIDAQKL